MGCASAEWFAADLQARYETIVRLSGDPAARNASPVPNDEVLLGIVTASRPPQLADRTLGLRAASVLLVVLGMASLGTGGVLSPVALTFGALTLHRHGGWRWLNDKDASLIMVGLTMALLLLPLTVIFAGSWLTSQA